MIAIDKEVPIPDRAVPQRERKYSFELMEVGDSFFVEGDPKKVGPLANNAVFRFCKTSPARFTMRTFTETNPDSVTGKTGARVWRTE